MRWRGAPEGRNEQGRQGRVVGAEKGGGAGGNVCPNAVFFPEIAITQMRCWLEGRCTSVRFACICMGLSENPCTHVCVRA